MLLQLHVRALIWVEKHRQTLHVDVSCDAWIPEHEGGWKMSRRERSFIALWGSHVPKATPTEPHLVHRVWQKREREGEGGKEGVIVCERLVETEGENHGELLGVECKCSVCLCVCGVVMLVSNSGGPPLWSLMTGVGCRAWMERDAGGFIISM